MVKHVHDSTHLGRYSLFQLMSCLFIGKDLLKTVKQGTWAYELCVQNNPNNQPLPPPLAKPVQHRGTYPGEDWQIDYTQIPLWEGLKYLLVFIDTFTCWIEGFPTWSEKATDISKFLLKEIIPRFGLPKNLQSDNGPFFTATRTQNISLALGIQYHLYSAWKPVCRKSRKGQSNFKENSCQVMPGNIRNLFVSIARGLVVSFGCP